MEPLHQETSRRGADSTPSPLRPIDPVRRGLPAGHAVRDGVLRAVPVALVLLALGAWELSARFELISPLFYPPPSEIAASLASLVKSGILISDLSASLKRIFSGFAIGGGAGLLVGLCMGWWRPLRLALDPLVAAVHPVPRLALLPLILLIFGIGETSRILVISMSCFFPLLINAIAGVRQIDPIHFEVARNFGARSPQVFLHVVLPGSLPSVMAGTRLSLISALKTTLAIELIIADRGLGHLVWQAWETFRPEELYATLVVIALLGIVMNAALKRLVAWSQPGGSMATP